MKIEFNNKKWIWTVDIDTSSAWFIFDYEDIEKINELEDLFKVKISWEEYNAMINIGARNPISIKTASWEHKYSIWEADTTLIEVEICMIKLDIFIPDTVSWLMRVEHITIIEKDV